MRQKIILQLALAQQRGVSAKICLPAANSLQSAKMRAGCIPRVRSPRSDATGRANCSSEC